MLKIKKSFKVLIAVLALLVSAFSLTACGKEDTSKTIIFYHTMGDSLQSVLKTAEAKFAEMYPGWKVSSSQIGGYDDVKAAIVADLQGQTQPNLAYCYGDHVAQYLTTQKVVDLSKFIESTDTVDGVKVTYKLDDDGEVVMDDEGNKVVDTKENIKVNVGLTAEEVADFVPGYYSEGLATNFANYDKYGYEATARLTIPFVKSTELVYYNATALKACGIVDEKGNAKAPETWDELWADAAIIKAKYPNSTPVGYDSEANWFITMCEQNGWGYTSAQEPHFLFNNDGAKKWLEELATYYDQGLVTTQKVYKSYTSNLFVKGADQGVAFSIGSSGGASHQLPPNNLFDWGITKVPGSKMEDGTIVYKSISQGPSLCMFYEDCENSEEKALMTWQFVKLLLEPEFLASFSIASGYNPPRKSVFDIPAYEKHLNGESITAAAANVAATMSNDFFTSPAFVGSSTARDQVGNVLVYALTSQKTADKALKDAYTNCGGK